MTQIGVPKERKDHEYRVGLTPESVSELVQQGHQVWVEHNAGAAIGFSDESYQAAGATLASSAEEVFQRARLIIKVKEPEAEEVPLLTSQHCLFTFLHLAPNLLLTDQLCASGATCIAYETVSAPGSSALPLLIPMSEIAGRLSIQAAARCLEMAAGGRGVLLSGATGVDPAQVLVIGGGIVGSNAVQMAMGLGANVTVMDQSIDRLRQLSIRFGSALSTRLSTETLLQQELRRADVVIGAVLVPGSSAPKIIRRQHLSLMATGSVIVDVAIDQGGFAESSKPTQHSQPTYVVEGVLHYCVTNMPGAVARTATLALNQVTLPFVMALANHDLASACQKAPGLRDGLNILAGQLVHPAIAVSQNKAVQPLVMPIP